MAETARVHVKPAGHTMHALASVRLLYDPGAHVAGEAELAVQYWPRPQGPPTGETVTGVGVELPEEQ